MSRPLPLPRLSSSSPLLEMSPLEAESLYRKLQRQTLFLMGGVLVGAMLGGYALSEFHVIDLDGETAAWVMAGAVFPVILLAQHWFRRRLQAQFAFSAQDLRDFTALLAHTPVGKPGSQERQPASIAERLLQLAKTCVVDDDNRSSLPDAP